MRPKMISGQIKMAFSFLLGEWRVCPEGLRIYEGFDRGGDTT